ASAAFSSGFFPPRQTCPQASRLPSLDRSHPCSTERYKRSCNHKQEKGAGCQQESRENCHCSRGLAAVFSIFSSHAVVASWASRPWVRCRPCPAPSKTINW